MNNFLFDREFGKTVETEITPKNERLESNRLVRIVYVTLYKI
jgi:hypothetical protein